MLIKTDTAKLSGHALNYAVALANKHEWRGHFIIEQDGFNAWMSYENAWGHPHYDYVSSWTGAGPLIEAEKISVYHYETKKIENSNKQTPFLNKLPIPKPYRAFNELYGPTYTDGDTYLEAAMRCYVLIKLGEKVEIPEKVLKAVYNNSKV